MQTITLFEYEERRYEVSETDTIDNGCLYLTEKTLGDLERLNAGIFFDIRRSTIRARNYVGVVRVSGLSIQILPKIIRSSDLQKHKRRSASNLLQMLTHSGIIPFSHPRSAVLDSEQIDLFEIFIRLFAEDLHHLVRHNRCREYVRQSDHLRFVKGKIAIDKFSNPARMHLIPCTYHNFSSDTLLNRTLKFTCYLMSRSVSDHHTISTLRSVISLLDQVTLVTVSVPELDRISYTRLNRIFEPFIRICRIFLQHSTLTLQVSHIESFALMIPMERLFETFIASVLKSDPVRFFGSGSVVFDQKQVGYLAKDEGGRHVFLMKPDIIIEKGGQSFIIDTKYKVLKPEDRKFGITQSDMYQMYAYARRTNARSCMLLYPDLLLSQRRDFIFNTPDREEIRLMIRSISLSYNLSDSKGWAGFMEELAGIIRPLLTIPDTPHSNAYELAY